MCSKRMVCCPSACAASYSFPGATRRPRRVAAWECGRHRCSVSGSGGRRSAQAAADDAAGDACGWGEVCHVETYAKTEFVRL
jgi:hypothetical protein